MTYKLKRQIVDKIHKLKNPDLLRIIANLLNIKTGVQDNENKKKLQTRNQIYN